MDFEMYSLCAQFDALYIGHQTWKHRIRKDVVARYVSLIPPFNYDAFARYVKSGHRVPLFGINNVQETMPDLPIHLIEQCIDATPMQTFKKDIFSGWKNSDTPFPVSSITTIALAKWAINKGLPRDERVTNIIAAQGNARVLRFLYYEGFPMEWPDCLVSALMNGQMHLVDWLADIELSKSNDPEEYVDKMRLLVAFLSFHSPNIVPALDWIKSSGNYVDVHGIMIHAFASDSVPSLQWVHDHFGNDNIGMCSYSIEMAFQNGDLHLLIWLYEVGWFSDTELVTMASEYGRLDVVRWATNRGLNTT